MKEKPPIKIVNAQKNESEWIMDDKGYFLIDPVFDEGLIYAHHYTKDRKYNISIPGKTAEDIYYTIIREELVSSFMHAAYLGSELQKAELHLKIKDSKYVQDMPLELMNNK